MFFLPSDRQRLKDVQSAVGLILVKLLKHESIMASQVEVLTEIRDGLTKVGAELTNKIDELIAAQGTELNKDAQAIAEEIKTKLAALDAIVPDAPPV